MELVRKEVEFHNCKLIGIQKDGNVFTPINYFCEVLGVNLASQLRKIKSDEAISQEVARMQLPTNGGEQEVYVLEISFLPLWLTGIKVNQCKEEVREFLLDFKLKAKDILTSAFIGKQLVEEAPKQLTFDYEQNEKQRDVCVNRLIGYVKEIIAYDEEMKRISKEIKTRLSLIKFDSETYYDSLK